MFFWLDADCILLSWPYDDIVESNLMSVWFSKGQKQFADEKLKMSHLKYQPPNKNIIIGNITYFYTHSQNTEK